MPKFFYSLTSLMNRLNYSKNIFLLGRLIMLAISRKMIIAHGGKIWAENSTEGEAKFSLTLPNAVKQFNH